MGGKISCLAFLLGNNYIDTVAINLVCGGSLPQLINETKISALNIQQKSPQVCSKSAVERKGEGRKVRREGKGRRGEGERRQERL